MLTTKPGSDWLRKPGSEVRSAVAMSDEEEKLTPVKAFLKHLNLGQHRDVMKTLGYDDPVRVSISPPGAAPGAAQVWAWPQVRDTWGCI